MAAVFYLVKPEPEEGLDNWGASIHGVSMLDRNAVAPAPR